ncbi:MAG: diaminobutyrate-2-oxoglutarate aminotransferase [Legionellales bacterium RIFCSPHIGHO2_12_FULL_42_9]|nr:MAG: diaminobutyrate-2-oxoglutarate aminotransferase [Legionellales bacterium RIFCSPHIGHO2_12_FULL_42_9]
MHHYQDLITIFNDCFTVEYNTRLVKGESEPLYLPASEARPYHAIYFAHGFFASALHECAHWLIAGAARRQREDFGYWYVPDGRTVTEQKEFMRVEVKPQAMEWVLSVATGHRFRVSIDNLNGAELDVTSFKQAVYQQVKLYCEQGLSQRAETFRNALCHFYGTPVGLKIADFNRTSV